MPRRLTNINEKRRAAGNVTGMDAKKRHLTAKVEPDILVDDVRLVHRPDGYYAQSEKGEIGPFPKAAEALEALAARDDESLEEGESLEEAEAELGLSGWLDSDSGEVAEESVPRLEDH